MSYLKVGDFSVKRKTLHLHGCNTKNHNDAVITLPDHVLKLMLELGVFNSPNHYYLFGEGFMPSETYHSEKAFRDYWDRRVRKALNMSARYKFYSLKGHGHNQHATCQHRHTDRARPGAPLFHPHYGHLYA